MHTIAYDNGREFSGHQRINAALGCESYFAKPYHGWERGLNGRQWVAEAVLSQGYALRSGEGRGSDACGG